MKRVDIKSRIAEAAKTFGRLHFGGGVALKALVYAAFAGCMAFGGQSAYAVDLDNIDSSLEKLHKSGAMIPGTDVEYPAGIYTFVEVNESESALPNVVKYYNPNKLDEEVHYFRVDLKQNTYGNGESVKYYRWTKDDTGVKLVETDNSGEAVLTLRYNEGDGIPKVIAGENEPLTLVDGEYVLQDIKKAIDSLSRIDFVSAKFIGNTIHVTNDKADEYAYSAVLAEAGAEIGSVNTSFVGNIVTSEANKTIYGTLVKSIGVIESVNSEFIGNDISAQNGINGGVVHASGIGKINEISSDFLLNRVSSGGDIEGGIVGNIGGSAGTDSVTYGIGTIRDSKFLGNYAISTGGYVTGVAIYNNGLMDTIGGSEFIGNYGKSDTNGAYGGAIYNHLTLNTINNTIFRDNGVESTSGAALGGAIYTQTNLNITATDNKLTEFTGNYVINNGNKENQAIYAANKEVALGFSATTGGTILLNDAIDGVAGYRVSFTGDGSGKISIYNGVNNAAVTVSGVNIDTADGNIFDYDFLSLNSYDSANYTIDIDFANNKADTFTVGANSQGVIYISELNVLSEMPTTDSIIQILKAPDTISIALTEQFIKDNTKTAMTNSSVVVDEIQATTTWGQNYNKHFLEEYTTTSFRTVASDGRTGADSIEYYHTTQTDETLESLGDTFVLVNREKSGNRSFNAVEASDVYEMSEDLGKTATGTLTVAGKIEGDLMSTIDANGYTMFDVTESGAKVTLQNLKITNFADTDGAVLNIAAGNTGTLSNVDIFSTSENLTNGIVNNGTLTVSNSTSTNLNTNIIGDGTLSISSYGTMNVLDGASISQEIVKVLDYATLNLSEDSSINTYLTIEARGSVYTKADNLSGTVYNKGINSYGLWLSGGTLNVDIGGNSNARTWIQEEVTLNADISNNIGLTDNSVLITDAGHIKGAIDKFAGNGSLTFTGGTLSKSVTASTINIENDVIFADTAKISGTTGTTVITEGSTLTTNASVFQGGNIQNNSILNLTGGTLNSNRNISGTGVTNITGTVTGNATIASTGGIHILEDAILNANANQLTTSIVNDSILQLRGGTLKQTVTGEDGLIEITDTVNSDVKLNQRVKIYSGAKLTMQGGRIGNDIENNGQISLQSGTIEEGHTISGTGSITVQGSNTVINYSKINNYLQKDGTFISNADLLGGTITGSGVLELTGGTLNYEASEGTVRVQSNNSVTSNAAISSAIRLLTGGSLTIGADNIQGDVTIDASSNLYVKDGQLDKKLAGNGTANIIGNVTTNDKSIGSKVVVADTGTLTILSELLTTSNITNNGKIYLSGVLAKVIAGEDGTTYIDGKLGIKTGAKIAGTFDLNNGELTSDNSYGNFNLGTVVNEGTLNFGLDISTLKNDKFTMNELSNGVFNISADTINFAGAEDNFDHTYQVLYGDSGAKLQLGEVREFELSRTEEIEDELLQSDVYYDFEFGYEYRNGVLRGEIELATSSTATNPDSVRVTTGETEWGEWQQVRADLLRALNQLNTEDKRHFRFYTADNTYYVLDNLGATAAGEINIHGVKDAETGKTSTIAMEGNTGFLVGNNTLMNVSDVTFSGSTDYVIKTTGNAQLGYIDENGVIQGGIIGTTIKNNTASVEGSGNVYGGAVYLGNTSIVYQIKDSAFLNNNFTAINSDINSNAIANGSALILYNSAQIGYIDENGIAQGGIINTIFDGNSASAAGDVNGVNIFMGSGTSISNIIDCQFKNSTSSQGSGIYLADNSIITNIENTKFSDNTASTRGAAIYNRSTITRIYNSIFENNTAETTQGGAIYSCGTIGEIINSVFEGNKSIKTGGGAIYIYPERGNYIDKITDTKFINNTSYGTGGAIALANEKVKINSITGSISFDSNSEDILEKIESINATTVFEGNKSLNSNGGAIEVSHGSIGSISGVLFKDNSALNGGALNMENGSITSIENSYFISNNSSNNGGGGAILMGSNTTSIGSINNSYFIDNTASSGSAIKMGANNQVIDSISNSYFIGNTSTYTSGDWGGAISINKGRINTISNTEFKNNSGWIGGGINITDGYVGTISDCLFEGNYTTNQGSAIYIRYADHIGDIINTSFINNYIVGKNYSSITSGALLIGNSGTYNLYANQGKTSEFTGNYFLDANNNKYNQAISVYSNGVTLSLSATDNGRFLFNDFIDGASGYNTVLTGDLTGKISLYNNIKNSNITAQNTNIDTADGNMFDYNFLSLNSEDSARYQIDIDFVNNDSDTFTFTNASQGSMVIDALNILNGDVNKTTKVQILHSPNNNIQLSLDSTKLNVVEDVIATCAQTVTDTSTFHQQTGYSVGTTDTLNDSIIRFLESDYDALSVIASAVNNSYRVFQFTTDKDYNVTYNNVLDNGVGAGTFAIKGLDGDKTTSTINLNGAGILNLSDASELQVVNTKITGADDIITVSNSDASVVLKNAYIDGNIHGDEAFNMNINGTGQTTIAGNVTNAQTMLTSGILSFGEKTFADLTDTLNISGGFVSLSDDNTVTDYYINKLVSHYDAGYGIDINLDKQTADKIVINDTTSSGTVTIESINYLLEGVENVESHVYQILDTNGNSQISLAIGKEVSRYEIKDLDRVEVDSIQTVTRYSDTYNVWNRYGKLCGDFYLTTTKTENDSLGFEVKELWDDTKEFDHILGDTLALVNSSKDGERSFVSDSSTDKYELGGELGVTAGGVLNLDGVTSTNGDEKSTINLGHYDGFVLAGDTTLNVNNTRITANKTENGYVDIITVTEDSSKINLNGAYIDGNIVGDEKFDISIGGSQATTITGKIINGDATLALGTLNFNTDTFADSSSSLTIQAGSININNGEVENYNIANLISSDKSQISIDVDLKQEIADTITVGEGSSGRIVLNELNFVGELSEIRDGDDYTIQILKNTANADIELQLSESVLSQINKEIKLGTDHVILEKDKVNATSLWSAEYWVYEQDRDIYGHLELATKETNNDSLHLFNLRVGQPITKEILGDTLKLLNQLDTLDADTGLRADRNFIFESADNTYTMKDYLGTTTEGIFNIKGVADENDKSVTSKIDMDKFTGFVLANDSQLTIENTTFENINFKDGSLINVSNKDSVVNLNNVYVFDTNCYNAVSNVGTLNMTGGTVHFNTGVIGSGVTNVIGGAIVEFGDGVSIVQHSVNVNDGSLTMTQTGLIEGALSIGSLGLVNVYTDSLVSAVVNDGHLNLLGGTLSQDVSGEGTTVINGEVLNSSTIDNNVDVQSGKLKTSADDIKGSINNSADLLLTGTLDKNVTGNGTTTVNESITLANGAGISGTLDLNNGKVSTTDGQTSDYNVGTMLDYGTFDIDLDLNAKQADKFIVGENSEGTVYIDSIDFSGSLKDKFETFKVQVLDTTQNGATAGTDAIQIALNDELTKAPFVVGTVTSNENDLRPRVYFDEIFSDEEVTGTVYGVVKLATTNTANDSIELAYSGVIWDDPEFSQRKDTLKELTQYETNEDKDFIFRSADNTYTVKEDLGEATAGNFNITGVADGDNRSKINFTDKDNGGSAYSGFELSHETTLNITNVEMSNAKDDTLITVTNEKAVINIKNDTLNGNIIGKDTKINITGDKTDVTTLNGTITDSDTKFDGGTLKFNTDTFADENDTLNVVSGRVDVQDSKIDTYDVTKLTSSEDATYSIDIDLSTKESDMISITDTTSSGIVYIDDINYMNGNLPVEFIAQILETNGNSHIQIKLSDEIKSKIYDFGTTKKNWDDLKADVDYDEYFHDLYQEGVIKGSIKEDTTKTTNDSISLKIDEPIWGEIVSTTRIDTLHEISDYVVDSDKTFNFKTSEDEYASKADVGEVHGTLSINGIKEGENLSKIDLKKYKGFELVENSKLNVTGTRLSNGSDNILMSAKDESAEVTLNNSQVDGVITGVKGYTVNITGDNEHIFDVRNDIQNAKINIDTVRVDMYDTTALRTSEVEMRSGLLNLTADEKVSDVLSSTFNIGGTFAIWADADLQNEKMDKLPSNTTIVDGASLKVSGINLISDTTAKSVAIPFAYKGFKDQVEYTGSGEISKETQLTTVYAPIYKYNIKYENREDMGYFVFSRQGLGGGNASEAYNPAVLSSPVATQAAGQSAMTETFRYVFEHADAFTQLPSMERFAYIKSNQYALSTDYNDNLGSLASEFNNKAGWVRPYTTFESINLSNGPKVNAITYGTLVGFDSDFHKLKKGWTNIGTGYIGYNGSQLNYSGVNTTTNGGLLGLTETFYKGNFWTAITATAGAGVAETKTMYGKEDSTMLLAGIGSKTGYNIEFKEGKYIVQPILFMSYTMVNTFDYTNAAGVRIKNDPMHTVQLNPSVRFISNLKGGWQPYASVGMVWNLLNETNSRANGEKLPEMHTKPYIEYGLGIQRRIKDSFTAFGQAMIRNGGRNGIAMTLGFRWNLGLEGNRDKNNEEVEQPNNLKTVQVERRVIKQLSEVKRSAIKGNKESSITGTTAVLKPLN